MKLKLLPQSLIDHLYEHLLHDDLQHIYSSFIEKYDTSFSKSYQGFYKSEISKINPIYRNKIGQSNDLIGIDLPTLFEVASGMGKLMILAQDPLRREKDFKREGKVIIGTPYSLHLNNYRCGRSKLYFNLLTQFTRQYKEFYLTDVAKVYSEKSNLIGLLQKREGKEVKTAAYQILANEIKTIRPNTILAMGNIAQSALNDNEINLIIEKNNIQRIDTPHMRARHTYWLKAGAQGSKYKDKIQYINNKLLAG